MTRRILLDGNFGRATIAVNIEGSATVLEFKEQIASILGVVHSFFNLGAGGYFFKNTDTLDASIARGNFANYSNFNEFLKNGKPFAIAFTAYWRPDASIHALFSSSFRDVTCAFFSLGADKPDGDARYPHAHPRKLPKELQCLILEFASDGCYTRPNLQELIDTAETRVSTISP